MTGLGNDLIDLKITDTARIQSPRFYTKILNDIEQQLYQTRFAVFPFEHFVWLLWSIKESAYKALQRHQPDLIFTPVKLVVIDLIPPAVTDPWLFTKKATTTGFNIDNCFNGTVHFNNQTLHARSIIYGVELIHTVVSSTNDFSGIHWGIQRITETDPAAQSIAVRELLLSRLCLLFPARELVIAKSQSGYPVVMADGIPMDWPVSLSHHGNFVGYAFAV